MRRTDQADSGSRSCFGCRECRPSGPRQGRKRRDDRRTVDSRVPQRRGMWTTVLLLALLAGSCPDVPGSLETANLIYQSC